MVRLAHLEGLPAQFETVHGIDGIGGGVRIVELNETVASECGARGRWDKGTRAGMVRLLLGARVFSFAGFRCLCGVR